MDNQRFDSLTRAMVSGKSRRDVLKLIAGGAAGGALAVVAIDDAAAACHGLACGAGCCSGTECVDGICVAMGSAPAPAPAAPAETTTVTTAPATGSGPLGGDSNAWLGVAAVSAAAALVGSRILRKDKESADERA